MYYPACLFNSNIAIEAMSDRITFLGRSVNEMENCYLVFLGLIVYPRLIANNKKMVFKKWNDSNNSSTDNYDYTVTLFSGYNGVPDDYESTKIYGDIQYGKSKNDSHLIYFDDSRYDLGCLLSFMPIEFPDLFPVNLNDVETNLCYCLVNATSEFAYARIVKQLYKNSNIHAAISKVRFEKYFKSAATLSKNSFIKTCKDENVNFEEQIESLEARIKEYIERIKSNENAIFAALNRDSAESDKEIISWLTHHDECSILDSNRESIYVLFKNNIDVDEDDYARLSSSRLFNNFSHFESGNIFSCNPNRCKLVADELMNSDSEYKLKVYSILSIDFHYNATKICTDRMQWDRVKDAIPNYHHHHHRCIGDFSARFDDAMRKGDITRLLELGYTSAGRINVNETSVTFLPFLENIFGSYSNRKMIECKDGTMISPIQLCNILEDKKENESN